MAPARGACRHDSIQSPPDLVSAGSRSIRSLLGAAGLGDIGQHFPPDDPQWKDASSLELLRQALALVREAQFEIGNVDATVIAEGPRLAPHISAMRERIAAALGLDVARVSVKATTHDGLGALGRGEGVAAMAVAALEDRQRKASE